MSNDEFTFAQATEAISALTETQRIQLAEDFENVTVLKLVCALRAAQHAGLPIGSAPTEAMRIGINTILDRADFRFGNFTDTRTGELKPLMGQRELNFAKEQAFPGWLRTRLERVMNPEAQRAHIQRVTF